MPFVALALSWDGLVHSGWLPLVLVGAMAGVLSGFFGIGGGWVAVPALNLLGVPALEAVGTSMAFLTGTGAMGAARHARAGNTRAPLAAWLAAPLLAGVEAGRRMMIRIAATGHGETVLRALFVAMLGGLGLAILAHALRGKRDAPPGGFWRAVRNWPPRLHPGGADGPVSLWVVLGGGLVTGVMAGLMGVGGGFLLVPLMMYGMGVPPAVSVGTSLLCVTAVGAWGAGGYAFGGHVRWLDTLALVAGSYAGVPVGVRACRAASPGRLRGLYGVMLAFAAASMAVALAGLESLARGILFVSAGGLTLAVTAIAIGRRAGTGGR